MIAKFLRSGDLSRLAGVSSDTLRHYERLGILPPSQRTNSGYRIYSHAAVERVRLAQITDHQTGDSLEVAQN